MQKKPANQPTKKKTQKTPQLCGRDQQGDFFWEEQVWEIDD